MESREHSVPVALSLLASEVDPSLQPNPRREEKIMAAIARGRRSPLLENSIHLSSQDRAAYSSWLLSTNHSPDKRNRDYAHVLSVFSLPINSESPQALFRHFDGDDSSHQRMRRIVSLLSHDVFQQSHQAADLSLLVQRFPNAVAFEQAIPRILSAVQHSSSPHEHSQRVQEYLSVINAVGDTLYGRQWHYLKLARRMEKEAEEKNSGMQKKEKKSRSSHKKSTHLQHRLSQHPVADPSPHGRQLISSEHARSRTREESVQSIAARMIDMRTGMAQPVEYDLSHSFPAFLQSTENLIYNSPDTLRPGEPVIALSKLAMEQIKLITREANNRNVEFPFFLHGVSMNVMDRYGASHEMLGVAFAAPSADFSQADTAMVTHNSSIATANAESMTYFTGLEQFFGQGSMNASDTRLIDMHVHHAGLGLRFRATPSSGDWQTITAGLQEAQRHPSALFRSNPHYWGVVTYDEQSGLVADDIVQSSCNNIGEVTHTEHIKILVEQ